MTGLKKRVLATVLGAGLVAGGVAEAPAQAQEVKTLNQGDGFTVKKSNGKWSGCTVGYVDTERKVFFTAAHCFTSLDDEVYFYDQQTRLGTPKYFASEPNTNFDADYAVVDYSGFGPVEGSNPYANEAAFRNEIVRGAEVCAYGNTTKEVRRVSGSLCVRL